VRPRADQPLLPGIVDTEHESPCLTCGARGRVVGRRQNHYIYSYVACEQVWEVFDATGPPCAKCGAATVVEPGRGPHWQAARCPNCRHHRWLKKPGKNPWKPLDVNLSMCENGTGPPAATPGAQVIP
jgi:hypothetical protein